jgi:hypothetical protein
MCQETITDLTKEQQMSDEMWNRIAEAIENSEPDKEAAGQKGYLIGNEYVFCLAQELKGVSNFDKQPREVQKDVVQAWYETYLTNIVDEKGEQLSFDEVWLQFLDAWPKAMYPKGMLLPTALDRARADTPPEAEGYNNPRVKLLVSICYQLQLIQGNKPFWLSTYDAGRIVGRTQNWGSKMLSGLVRAGVLELIKQGKGNQASRFRYISRDKKEQLDPVSESPDPEITELLIKEYGRLINKPSFRPDADQMEKFVEATKRVVDFRRGSRAAQKHAVKYLIGCLEKHYVGKGKRVYPGHLCSDTTWQIILPQYYQEMGEKF